MNSDDKTWFLNIMYQEILLEINIQIKSNELIAMMDEDNARSISESSDETSDCSKKSDSGYDDNISDDNGWGKYNVDIGNEDKMKEKADNDSQAVVENYRTYFTKFVAPPPASLPAPQWCVTNNGEDPGSKVNKDSATVVDFFKRFASSGTNSTGL